MTRISQKSFELIYKKLALPLTKFIVKRAGGDQNMVDEVLSRTWIASWKGWDTFENKSSYFTWLCRISLNKIADYYREQVNENSVLIAPFFEDLAALESQDPSPEERLALEDLRKRVNQCLDLLPPDKRRLLHLRYWRQLTIREISKKLGVSERAIEGQLYRARKSLEGILTVKNPELVTVYERGNK